MTVKFSADLRQAERVLTGIVTRLSNFRPALTQMGDYMIARTRRNFRGEHDPYGNPWKKVTDKTYAEKVRNHKILKILQRDRNLLSSIHHEVSAKKVRIGSKDIKSRIHQLGGKAGRGRKVEIPARPYLGATSEDEKEIERIGKIYIGEAVE